MLKNKTLLWTGLAIALTLAVSTQGFSQVQTVQTTQNRIPHQVIINGQTVNGAYVTAPGGGMQSFTCANPQQYVTADGASQGWACYEQATGTWLLNALPPAQAAAPAPVPVPQVSQVPQPVPQTTVIYQQPPQVIYQQPATVVYATPVYSVYPAYPVVVVPAYPSSVVLGRAAINAAGRIVAAAVSRPHYGRVYYVAPSRRGRRW